MNRAAKPATQQRPLCVVSIDHVDYALPFADGQKVMELMTRAQRCDRDYSKVDHQARYVVRGPARLEMAVAMPGQFVVPPSDRPAAALAIGRGAA